MNEDLIAEYIKSTIVQEVRETRTITRYREPLIGYASAKDSRFELLREVVDPTHKLPKDLLPSARSVVSFFLPFNEDVVEANAQEKERVAEAWVEAYIETNALIEDITERLVEGLRDKEINATAEPPTGNFNRDTLVSSWAHKSVAVIAGLGSFGLHHLVITDSGCAGRFGSLVLDTDLPIHESQSKERCLYFVDGSCLECVLRCPVGALDQNEGLDKQLCWEKCQKTAAEYHEVGQATVCGKCAVGVCSMVSST